MIVDSFDYIACYKGLHPNLDKAIDWLNSHTLDALENGKTIIDGENVFVNVMDADLRDADGAAFEYHRRYADLQIDLTGSEHLGLGVRGHGRRASLTRKTTSVCESGPEHCRHDVLGGGTLCRVLPRRAAQAQLQEPRLRPRKKSRGQDFDEIICIPQAFPLGGRWPAGPDEG